MKSTKPIFQVESKPALRHVVMVTGFCLSLSLVACTPTSPVVDRNFGVATKAAKDAQRIPPKYSLNKDAPPDASRELTGALENHFNSATKPGPTTAGSGESTQSLKLED